MISLTIDVYLQYSKERKRNVFVLLSTFSSALYLEKHAMPFS